MVVYENTNSQLYKMKFELHISKNWTKKWNYSCKTR